MSHPSLTEPLVWSDTGQCLRGGPSPLLETSPGPGYGLLSPKRRWGSWTTCEVTVLKPHPWAKRGKNGTIRLTYTGAILSIHNPK